MSLFIGASEVSSIFVGNTEIKKIYKGEQLLYESFSSKRFDESGEFLVPANVTQLKVDMTGAEGFGLNQTNARGGLGGRVECILNVTPNTKLFIKVGHKHTVYNDGTYDASDIRMTSDDLNSRLIVAGAGGAGVAATFLGSRYYVGGAGGGLTAGSGGGSGRASGGIGGGGGTQTNGGSRAYFSNYLKSRYATAGSFGLGGAPLSERGGTGYGGAGWYGGGGGVDGYYYKGSSEYGNSAGAAGGGSSYTHPTLCLNVVHTQSFQAGNGYVIISKV